MSDDLVPAPKHSVTPTDSDHRYKAIQHQLGALARALDGCEERLQQLKRRKNTNAGRSEQLAADIAHADLGEQHVERQNLVSVALDGASVEVSMLADMAGDLAADAEAARRRHAELYEDLDTIRSGRPDKTPKPGFFVRPGG
ncbi:conjugal transfer protein TraB [Streptomyces sp. MNP-20]|uniref:conjugal transfer protein TraB n=1 Tax=Streptomyces sp. MNP-20 TaxID=2721165 RepID=UPI00155511A3|nr:conjugal transfer protein TraB [Streptomyces sp. MNP-20]